MQTNSYTDQIGTPGDGSVPSAELLAGEAAQVPTFLKQPCSSPVATRIGACKTKTEVLIELIDSHQLLLVLWAKGKFPRLTIEDCEEKYQDLLVEIWQNGPACLGILPLIDVEELADHTELFNCLGENFEILIRRLKRRLYQLLIDSLRRKKSKIRGGNAVHVDLEDMKDYLEGPCGTITVEECRETLKELIKWLEECLSERERIIAPIWLRYLPFRPTVDEIYKEMSPEERERFLPRNHEELSDEAKEALIKSQISRTRASLENKIAEFGRDQR